MNDIKVTQTGKQISVVSPYNPAFVARAKEVGGKWDPSQRAWTFPVEAEDVVREALLEHYGYSEGSTETCTIRVRKPDSVSDTASSSTVIRVGGREVARAFDRDSGAKVADGVIVEQGGFGSGGSRKNPDVTENPDTVVRITEMPRTMADRLVSKHPEHIEIIEEADDRKRALEAERERLAARMAEIDRELADLG